jgi:predicted site-specific integrase-resolvase
MVFREFVENGNNGILGNVSPVLIDSHSEHVYVFHGDRYVRLVFHLVEEVFADGRRHVLLKLQFLRDLVPDSLFQLFSIPLYHLLHAS